MSEFITIQVGQCGNQIGAALWPKILQEYNVVTSGGPVQVRHSLAPFFHVPPGKNRAEITSLQEMIDGKVRARAICIDMEESVVARYRTGVFKGLFDDKYLITNYPGCGNNWAEGFCEQGPLYQNKILNSLRHSVEKCDSLHGFLLVFSTGGGTGSGVGTYVLSLLADYYPKIERFVCCVYSNGTEDVITSPYNNVLATRQLLEHATCVFPAENRSLLDISLRKEKHSLTKQKLVNYSVTDSLNGSVVDMLMHLTSGSRFAGSLNFDMNEINTNMVPYPKLNFLAGGFNHLAKLNNDKVTVRLKEEQFAASCHRSNQLIQLDPLGPKSVLLASTVIGRGDYTINDLRGYVEKIQRKAKFAVWSRKSVKMGLCHVAPPDQKAALFALFNTTAMAGLFKYLDKQFMTLFRRQAHVHHYTAVRQFDWEYFLEAKQALEDIVEKYGEVATPRIIPSRLLPSVT